MDNFFRHMEKPTMKPWIHEDFLGDYSDSPPIISVQNATLAPPSFSLQETQSSSTSNYNRKKGLMQETQENLHNDPARIFNR
ncbi:hypothetical protein PPL_12495 [Heterostelium album PN500]|uniref:Uncharacterized protein n=1 Tax=Heterostelium pallidum (strain ATCC 26659 / Pp 5 / PN500) TaxID=670386 RepID=D3BMS2_HETP5|nr:hypothetical protein PPL_12495 [Heterostelium album PN500]EFA77284.1 hypothetical protein PPL_12495 [Heterostelium album PN500]|eukprot:XP_020429413.1 hypothetical protein PPL_12495 [Heterostelium album PN500]